MIVDVFKEIECANSSVENKEPINHNYSVISSIIVLLSTHLIYKIVTLFNIV